MKTILVRSFNDRGGEQRISTNEDKMELTVFFKGEHGEVRKENLILKRTESGSLRVENENQLLWQSEGDCAEKLDFK